MPIYEFRCSHCGHAFEELVFGRSELEELTCPKCGKGQVEQQFSTFASVGGGDTSSRKSRGCRPGSFT